MVVYIVETFVNIEHSLFYLIFRIFLRVKLVLLSHFVDEKLFSISSVFNILVEPSVDGFVPIVGHTTVDKLVLSTLISLKSLVSNLFLSVDETIFVSVVIEVNLSVSVVNLDQFLPIVVLFRRFVVFDGLELVRQSSSQDKLISSELILGSNFLNDQLFLVFVDCDSFHKPVNLFAVREELNLALFVENGLFSFWA